MPSDQNRREFLGFLTTIVGLSPLNGLAETAPRRPLIGFLASNSKAGGARYYDEFPRGMRERGYDEGRQYTLVYRYADGNLDRLPSLAEELVRLKPDVIVASNTAAALATKQATASIPIIGGALTNVAGMGVPNDARPAANVTGIRTFVEGQAVKQLEIALDLVPGITKIAFLLNANSPTTVYFRQEVEPAATKLGVTLVPIEAGTGDEIGPGFQTLLRAGANVVVVSADAMFLNVRRQISAFALASRVPTIYSYREHVEDGGLISYGVNLRQSFRRIAYYVDRILRGANVTDLPIEFPTSLELVINLPTAKAMGLEVPPTLLARADEVIE